jgi:hypothetical protein
MNPFVRGVIFGILYFGGLAAGAWVLGSYLWPWALAQPTGTNTAPNKVPVTTFANLPACNSGNEGLRWGISDATAPTSLSNAAGGGAVHVAVYCSSTNWIVQ